MNPKFTKLFLVGCLFPLFYGFSKNPAVPAVKAKTTYVHLCIGDDSNVYHYDSECRGMDECEGEIKEVKLVDAIEDYNGKVCMYER